MRKRKHRVAFCITELEVGGAEKFASELACRIDRDRFELDVFVLAGAPRKTLFARKLAEHQVPVTFLGIDGWRSLPGGFARFVAGLRGRRIELLQSFMFHANIVSRLAARVAGVPRVVCGLRVAEREKTWHLLIDTMTSPMVDRYVCVSRSVADFARSWQMLPEEKLLVIPNAIAGDNSGENTRPDRPVNLEAFFQGTTGVPPDEVGDAFPEDDGLDGRDLTDANPGDTRLAEVKNGKPRPYYVVTVSRLDYQKGVDWLLTSIVGWVKSFPDLRFLIVGEGPLEQVLRSFLRTSGLDRHVALLGFREDVIDIIRSADLFVLPSRWEGMPNALLEAMSVAMPVVASDVEGVREVLGPNCERQLIPPGDREALRCAILWHYFHRDESRELGQRNRQFVSVQFSWDDVVGLYQELWTRLLHE